MYQKEAFIINDEFMRLKDEQMIYEFYKKYNMLLFSENINKKFMEMKNEDLIYWAGYFWKEISTDNLNKKFKELTNEYRIIEAIKDWKHLSDVLIIDAFKKLKNDECIYYAGKYLSKKEIISKLNIETKFMEIKDEQWVCKSGRDWAGLNNDILNKKFELLKKDEWIYEAGTTWRRLDTSLLQKKIENIKSEKYLCLALSSWNEKGYNITLNNVNERFLNLVEDEWINWAGRYWQGISQENLNKKFKELKDEHHIITAGQYWENLDADIINEVFMQINEKKFLTIAGAAWHKIYAKNLNKKFLDLPSDYDEMENCVYSWGKLAPEVKYEKLVNILVDGCAEKTISDIKTWQKNQTNDKLNILVNNFNEIINLLTAIINKKQRKDQIELFVISKLCGTELTLD